MTGRHRILLIEDEPDIRDTLALALEHAGYAVTCAEHGREALSHLADSPLLPDLILLDWMMPVMSGFEFLTYVAAEPAYKRVPVVILSAVDRALKTTGFPVAALLTKPIRLRTLVDVLDRLCGLPRRPPHLFPAGRIPAVGTAPPFGDGVPTPKAETPSGNASKSRPTPVMRPKQPAR